MAHNEDVLDNPSFSKIGDRSKWPGKSATAIYF